MDFLQRLSSLWRRNVNVAPSRESLWQVLSIVKYCANASEAWVVYAQSTCSTFSLSVFQHTISKRSEWATADHRVLWVTEFGTCDNLEPSWCRYFGSRRSKVEVAELERGWSWFALSDWMTFGFTSLWSSGRSDHTECVDDYSTLIVCIDRSETAPYREHCPVNNDADGCHVGAMTTAQKGGRNKTILTRLVVVLHVTAKADTICTLTATDWTLEIQVHVWGSYRALRLARLMWVSKQPIPL